MNRRLDARGLDSYKVKVDGVLSLDDLASVRKTAWALGALPSTYEAITKKREVPEGVQRMIRNPGRRTDKQLARAERRMSQMRADRARRAKKRKAAKGGRLIVVNNCMKAASNYRKNPRAYHYLAGGIPNLMVFTPSPRTHRSDCSQFASGIQDASGLRDLGPNGPLYVNTVIMSRHLDLTTDPKPGDFGMYGTRNNPHHVEVRCEVPGHFFIGHGSPPIDSQTPGLPDYYLANPLGG